MHTHTVYLWLSPPPPPPLPLTRLSIVAINIDSDDGDRERISDPLTINITTLAVGDPQVPNITSVRDITDISATLCWMEPRCVCVCVCLCVFLVVM